MRSGILRSVVGLAMLSMLLMVSMIARTSGQGMQSERAEAAERSESQGRKLEGTWRTHVTIRDCQTGAALRTFPALLTFADGGTLTETTTGFSPAQRSPGHGYWRRIGNHSYRAVSEAFLFNPAGVWVATQRLTQTIEIGADAEHFNSTATNEIYDTNGNLTATGCATAVGDYFE